MSTNLLDPTKFKARTKGFTNGIVKIPQGIYPIKEIHEDGFIVMDGLNGWDFSIPLYLRKWYEIEVIENEK